TVTNIWDQFYIGINQCNTVIERAPNIVGMSDENKTKIIGEARLLRALFYFHLVQQFGDIHFSLVEAVGVKTDANRTSPEVVYNEGILPDLEFAAANLPSSATDYGRAYKPAAEA